MFWEETTVLVAVILAVPLLVYALQKLTGRNFNNKLIILLLYLLIFFEYLEVSDRISKGQLEEDRWLPTSLVEQLKQDKNK